MILKVIARDLMSSLIFIVSGILIIAALEIISLSLVYSYVEGIDNLNDLTYLDYKINSDFFLKIILTIFILKILFGLFFTFIREKKFNSFRNFYSDKLFKKYSEEHLPFIDKTGYNKISRDINYEVNYLGVYIKSAVIIFSELILILLIFSYFFYLNSLISLIFLFAFVLMFFIYGFFTNSRQKKWGEDRLKNELELLKITNFFFKNLIDIKLYDNNKSFQERFKFSNKKNNYLNTKINFLASSSKFIIELIIIMLGTLLYFLSILFPYLKETLIPLITVGLVALFRLLPSFNLIISSNQNLRSSYPSAKMVLKQIQRINNPFEHYTEYYFSETIELRGISFSYMDKPIFENLNIKLYKNKINYLVGESGAGKTTLLKILMGFLEIEKGEILIDNYNIKLYGNKFHFQNISYLSQNVETFEGYLTDNITFFNSALNENSLLKDSISNSRVDDFFDLQNQSKNRINDNSANFSGGQIQRIGLARMFFKENAEILFFDEPFVGLDKINKNHLLETIKRLSKNHTVVLINHEDIVINNCNYINLGK